MAHNPSRVVKISSHALQYKKQNKGIKREVVEAKLQISLNTSKLHNTKFLKVIMSVKFCSNNYRRGFAKNGILQESANKC